MADLHGCRRARLPAAALLSIIEDYAVGHKQTPEADPFKGQCQIGDC